MRQGDELVACSNCFVNEGLRLDAERLGDESTAKCPRCATNSGRKLRRNQLVHLAKVFFVWGSLHRTDYGSAPIIEFNDRRGTDMVMKESLRADAAVFENTLGVGFFWYGPRTWMLGEVEPLQQLLREETRAKVIERIIHEYKTKNLTPEEKFYRLRKNPKEPSAMKGYDSAPAKSADGRLNRADNLALYASPDLQTCLHECRVSAEDELFVATLKLGRDLTVLDVSDLLEEPEGISEFESLDLAINMLFLAGKHSYPITQEIARATRAAGYDGLICPSYFSMLRNGVKPIETTYGISHRKIEHYKDFEKQKISANIAIFGCPIEEGTLDV